MTDRRIRLMFEILIIFLLLYGVFWLSIRTATPAPGSQAATPSLILSPTSTVEQTPQPSPPTGLSKFLEPLKPKDVTIAAKELEETVTAPVVAIARLVTAVLIGLAALYLLAWFIDALRRPRQLVLADLVNASGDDSLDKLLPGISQRNRGSLLGEVRSLQEVVRENVEQQAPSARVSATRTPFPHNAPKDVVEELVKSIQDVSPAQYKLLAYLAQLFFPIRGTRVICTLQKLKESPSRIGLTLEICDLQGQEASEFKTFEEVQRETRIDCLPPCKSVLSITSMTVATEESIPAIPTEVLIRLANALAAVALFEDALPFLKEVLQFKQPTSGAAFDSLANCLARLQTQTSAGVSYALAKQLEDAGLFQSAAYAYGQALPVAMQQIVVQQWSVVFGLLKGDKALAYCRLARIYRKVFLFDRAKALYRLAVDQGSPLSLRATRLVEMMQRQTSERLIDACQCLCQLKRYSEAEKYALMALDRVPDSPQSKRILAEILKSKSAAGGQATTAALQDRYWKMVKSAMRWLALELLRRETIAGRPRGLSEDDLKRYDAEVHNFLGALHLAYGYTYRESSSGKIFLDQSLKDLVWAIDLQPDWYLPYENLAGAHILSGCYCGDPKENQRHQERALKYLDLAAQKSQSEIILGHASQFDKLRIRATRVWAMLLVNDDDRITEVQDEIKEMEVDFQSKDFADCREPEFWRVLTVMYALADRYGARITNAHEKARKYLAYTLARDGRRKYWERDFQQWVENDPMLSCILEGLPELKEELELALIESPDIPQLSGEVFEETVKSIMKSAGWLKEMEI